MMGVLHRVMSFFGLQDEEEDAIKHKHVEYSEDPESNHSDVRKHKGNIVSIHSQKTVRVILNEPMNYEDTQEIADHLRSRRSVVVNLHRAGSDQAVRIVDFLSGTVYALNGSISKVGHNIFLCTPDTVEIQGSITEAQLNNDDYKQ